VLIHFKTEPMGVRATICLIPTVPRGDFLAPQKGGPEGGLISAKKEKTLSKLIT
jgi:hypothetical protein